MSSLRIRKVELVSDFTMVPNAFLLDDRMSGLAKWAVLTYWSKPEGWSCNVSWLETVTTDGREALRTALTLAEECGYLVRVRRQGDGGRFYTETHVSLVPLTVDEIRDIQLHGSFQQTGTRRSASQPTGHAPLNDKKGSKTGTQDEVPSRRRSAPAGDRPRRPFQGREPDDPTGTTDEGPALGGSPKAFVEQLPPDRPTTGRALAQRLQRLLAANSEVTGSLAVVDVGLLSKRLNELHRTTGMSRDVQRTAIDLFARNPRRYLGQGDYKGWTGFLAALPKLEADAGKVDRATSTERHAYDPYEGLQ